MKYLLIGGDKMFRKTHFKLTVRSMVTLGICFWSLLILPVHGQPGCVGDIDDISENLGLPEPFELCDAIQPGPYGVFWDEKIYDDDYATCEDALQYDKNAGDEPAGRAIFGSVVSTAIHEKTGEDPVGNKFYDLTYVASPSTDWYVELRRYQWPNMWSLQMLEIDEGVAKVGEHEYGHMNLAMSVAAAYRPKAKVAWAVNKYAAKNLENSGKYDFVFWQEKKLDKWLKGRKKKIGWYGQKEQALVNKIQIANDIYDLRTQHGLNQAYLGGENTTINFLCDVQVDPALLPEAYMTQPYHVSLDVFVGPYPVIDPLQWSIVSGTLPPSMQLLNQGLLSGTPQQDGVYSFTVRAEELNGGDGVIEKDYMLLVVKATVIDFEALAMNDDQYHEWGTTYSKNGFTLETAENPNGYNWGLLSYGTNHPFFQGSTGVMNLTTDSYTLLTNDAGNVFDLLSIDLSECEYDPMWTDYIMVIEGERPDGNIVSTWFYAVKGDYGFDTFLLPENFVGLIQVRLYAGWSPISFDNIVLIVN